MKPRALLALSVFLILAFSVNSAYADPDRAIFMSPLVWTDDAEGDYTFEEACNITDTTYELKTPYTTKGSIYKLAAYWVFEGEVTLQVSATGLAKDYVDIVNGVPLEVDSRFRGNDIGWKATLTPGSKLTELRITYADTYGVVGSFGNPDLSGFMFRKPIHIKGSSEDLFHYQVPIRMGESADSTQAQVTLKGVIQSDFDDVRFTAADQETTLPYWLEDIMGTSPDRTATFWVKLPHIPPDGILVYLYYGNSEVALFSGGEEVFDFFDEFNKDTLDTVKWETVLSQESSSVNPSYDGLRLDGAMIKANDYTLTNGIMEFKAKTEDAGAIVSVVRGSASGTNDLQAYSSNENGSEHCITVSDVIKANKNKGISKGKYYNYVVSADGDTLTFKRYNRDKTSLEAEVEYANTGGIAGGYIGLSTSSQGTGVYYDRVFTRKLASPEPEVDILKTKAAKEEVPNIAAFENLEISANGNLTLKDTAKSGGYVSPLIHSPFKARVVVPSWTMEEGALEVDISATEYGIYKENCVNASYYYASTKDFAEGDKLRWRASLRGGDEVADEAISPSLKDFTMDFRLGRINLISPNGGEYAKVGSTFMIKWDATDFGPKYGIKIGYSIDGGVKFNTIAGKAMNKGVYAWTVPDAATTKAVVRISDGLYERVYDVSNNYFSIGSEEGEIQVDTDEEEITEDIVEEEEEEVVEERAGAVLYEMLIKIGDNAGYGEGDIIMIQPAGFIWGKKEKENFLIVKAYLTPEEVAGLMNPEKDAGGRVVKRRKYKVDLEDTDIIQAKVEMMRGLLASKPLIDMAKIKSGTKTVVQGFFEKLRKPAKREKVRAAERKVTRSSEFRKKLLELRRKSELK